MNTLYLLRKSSPSSLDQEINQAEVQHGKKKSDLLLMLKLHTTFAAFSVNQYKKENLPPSIKVSSGKYHCKTLLCHVLWITFDHSKRKGISTCGYDPLLQRKYLKIKTNQIYPNLNQWSNRRSRTDRLQTLLILMHDSFCFGVPKQFGLNCCFKHLYLQNSK